MTAGFGVGVLCVFGVCMCMCMHTCVQGSPVLRPESRILHILGNHWAILLTSVALICTITTN